MLYRFSNPCPNAEESHIFGSLTCNRGMLVICSSNFEPKVEQLLLCSLAWTNKFQTDCHHSQDILLIPDFEIRGYPSVKGRGFDARPHLDSHENSTRINHRQPISTKSSVRLCPFVRSMNVLICSFHCLGARAIPSTTLDTEPTQQNFVRFWIVEQRFPPYATGLLSSDLIS